MSSFASLHKILKDETRSKIILLLDEKDSLSYTDLMETLGFLTTGLLNYHLKVLGDLLAKNEAGQYILSERGELAAKFLKEFPDAKHPGLKPKWWRKFWIGAAFLLFFVLVSQFVLFFYGYIDSSTLYKGLITAVLAVGFAYMIQHILRDVLSKERQLRIAKIAWTSLGAWLGWASTFFGAVAISAFYRSRGEVPLLADSNGWWYLVLSFLVAPIVGGLIGYWFGKRRRFKTPNYNPDA